MLIVIVAGKTAKKELQSLLNAQIKCENHIMAVCLWRFISNYRGD